MLVKILSMLQEFKGRKSVKTLLTQKNVLDSIYLSLLATTYRLSVPVTRLACPGTLVTLSTMTSMKYRDQVVTAVVVRTGCLTTFKGDLVRSVLYPPPGDFSLRRTIPSS